MELSILPTGTPTGLTSSAPNTDSPPPSTAASMTITPLVGVSKAEQAAAFSESMAARNRLGDDTQDIARALQKTMQTIILQRPDLAESTFDFVSKNGSLQVVSTEFSLENKSWLAAQLNANAVLVQSVQAFNEDATTVYNLAAGENPTAVANSAGTVSDQVDGTVKFLSFLNSLGSDVQSTMDQSGGTYTMPDGSPVDLRKAPDSPASFLSFAAQMQAAADGDVILKLHGKSYSHSFKMPNAYVEHVYI